MFLIRLAKALDREKVDYALVGGLAVALHGAVRGTVDVDLVIKLNKAAYISFEKAMTALGLSSRLPVKAEQVFMFREEYIINKNLVAWSFSNPQNATEIVDVIITHDLSKLKTIDKKINQTPIKILSIQDLIKMKKEAGRPQDLEDIKALTELA